MESIEINGFLTIDHAHFEIKKINILIGAQAQGKSVIAKLVYFFKSFFSKTFIPSIERLEIKRDIDKKCLAEFEQIFPRYTWSNQEFSIIYRYENCDISIVRAKTANKYTLKFNYCKELANFHKELKNIYKSALSDNKAYLQQENEHWSTPSPTKKELIFHDTFSEKINNSPFSRLFEQSIFIPAGRSFFAALQKNIFSFLANDINIDPFIKEFGSRYEQAKHLHYGLFFHHHDESEVIKNKVDKLVSSIVAGEYVYEEEQDWILSSGKKTNLANASSGQQEALPMLLILKVWPFITGSTSPSTFFIEEPEAHLFPSSQKQIISLIATLYNTFGHPFFITTHSPYILTALNNLVVGQDAYNKVSDNSEHLKALAKVLPINELIHLEDVSAYTLNKGKLDSIIDLENRLIGANLLDVVSDEFDSVFDMATNILYGTD